MTKITIEVIHADYEISAEICALSLFADKQESTLV